MLDMEKILTVTRSRLVSRCWAVVQSIIVVLVHFCQVGKSSSWCWNSSAQVTWRYA